MGRINLVTYNELMFPGRRIDLKQLSERTIARRANLRKALGNLQKQKPLVKQKSTRHETIVCLDIIGFEIGTDQILIEYNVAAKDPKGKVLSATANGWRIFLAEKARRVILDRVKAVSGLKVEITKHMQQPRGHLYDVFDLYFDGV